MLVTGVTGGFCPDDLWIFRTFFWLEHYSLHHWRHLAAGWRQRSRSSATNKRLLWSEFNLCLFSGTDHPGLNWFSFCRRKKKTMPDLQGLLVWMFFFNHFFSKYWLSWLTHLCRVCHPLGPPSCSESHRWRLHRRRSRGCLRPLLQLCPSFP